MTPGADTRLTAPCRNSVTASGHRGRLSCRDGNGLRNFVVFPGFLTRVSASLNIDVLSDATVKHPRRVPLARPTDARLGSLIDVCSFRPLSL